MKAYKVTLLIVDHNGQGGDWIKNEFESAYYTDDCIVPQVMNIESSEIDEWHDGHPLNSRDVTQDEFERLFPVAAGATRDTEVRS